MLIIMCFLNQSNRNKLIDDTNRCDDLLNDEGNDLKLSHCQQFPKEVMVFYQLQARGLR